MSAFADAAAHLAFQRNHDPVGTESLLLQFGNNGPVHNRRPDDNCHGIIGDDSQRPDQRGNQADTSVVAVFAADIIHGATAGKAGRFIPGGQFFLEKRIGRAFCAIKDGYAAELIRTIFAILDQGAHRRQTAATRDQQQILAAQPWQIKRAADAWFALGTLELDLRHAEAADVALRQYLQLMPAAGTPDVDDKALNEARQQAWLMLAQAAEQRGDLKGAEAWLLKVDAPERRLDTQFRRASLLARQGKLDQGVKLIQALPEETADDSRAKLTAEAQLLRDARDWKGAFDVLALSNEKFPDNADLIYEQSMMAEKLGRLDEMEALLKRVIALKPEYHHAYNALGYSLAERNVRLGEARDLIVKALSLAPAEPFIVDSMGWVEYRLGNRLEALRLLRQAYAARPDPEIAAHLGEVLWVNGEQDEARRVWREGAQRDPKNEALRETMSRLKARL